MPIPYTEWKKPRARVFDATTRPQIKRWRKAVLPVLYRLGAEILRNFDRRYGGGKSALLRADFEVLAEIPDLEWKAYLETKETDPRFPTEARHVALFNTAKWAAHFERVAGPLVADAIRQGGKRLVAEIGAGVFDPTAKAVRDELGRRVVEHSKFLAEGTDKIVQTHIRAGIRNGESIPQVRNRLIARLDPADKATFNSVRARAETIARTEVVGAHNAGNRGGMLQSGVKTRIWVSMGDANVRDSHAEMDGQELSVDKPWNVRGHEMWYPCDINERCSEFPGKMGARPSAEEPVRPTAKPTAPKPAKPKPAVPKPKPRVAKPKPAAEKPAEFVSAKTVEEAETWAKERGVKANYRGLSTEQANDVNRAVEQSRKSGLTLPEEIAVDRAELESLLAGQRIRAAIDVDNTAAVTTGKRIVINNKADLFRVGTKAHKQIVETKWFADPTMRGAVNHEIAHIHHRAQFVRGKRTVEDYINFGNERLQIRHRIDPPPGSIMRPLSPEFTKIMEETSGYAMTARAEFVAEVTSGIQSGKKYSDATMDLFKKSLGEGVEWTF